MPSFLFGSANTSKSATPSLFGNKEKSSTTTSLFNITNPKSNEDKDTATTKPLFGKLQLNLKPFSTSQSLLLVHQLLQINQLLVLVRPQILRKKQHLILNQVYLVMPSKLLTRLSLLPHLSRHFLLGLTTLQLRHFHWVVARRKILHLQVHRHLRKTDTTKDDTKPTETTSLFGDKSKSGSTTPFTFGQKMIRLLEIQKKKTNWLQQLNHLVQGLPLEHLLKLLKAMMDLKENQIMMLLQVQLQQQQQSTPSSLVLLIKQPLMRR